MILGTEPFEVGSSDGKIRASSRDWRTHSEGFPTQGKLKANENNANKLKQSACDGPAKL